MDLNECCKGDKVTMSYEQAKLKAVTGQAITREFWKDLNMFVVWINGNELMFDAEKIQNRIHCKVVFEELNAASATGIMMLHTNDGRLIPFEPSQHDTLVNDWHVVSNC